MHQNYIYLTRFIVDPKYSRASVSAVYRGPKKNWEIKEINGSQVSKHAASENGP
jgi:hypothetical protein